VDAILTAPAARSRWDHRTVTDHLPERIVNAVWMMAPGGTGLMTIGEI